MTLILPEPPSANHYFGQRVIMPKGARIPAGARKPYVHIYRTDFADLYAATVARVAHAANRTPLDGEVAVTLEWHRGALRGDLDNRLKVVLDALQGWCYKTDAQIAELHAYRYLDRENPRAEITVRAMETPQLTL